MTGASCGSVGLAGHDVSVEDRDRRMRLEQLYWPARRRGARVRAASHGCARAEDVVMEVFVVACRRLIRSCPSARCRGCLAVLVECWPISVGEPGARRRWLIGSRAWIVERLLSSETGELVWGALAELRDEDQVPDAERVGGA